MPCLKDGPFPEIHYFQHRSHIVRKKFFFFSPQFGLFVVQSFRNVKQSDGRTMSFMSVIIFNMDVVFSVKVFHLTEEQ